MLEIIGMLLFLGLIGLSIGLHELGHLIPAKKFGVKVTEYAIGFGPTILRKQWGETDVRLRLLPLGGFIRMIGMYLPERADGKKVGGKFAETIDQARAQSASEISAADAHRTFYKLSVPKPLIVMVGGPFMNLVLATVLFTVLLSGMGLNQTTTTIGSIVKCVPTVSDLAGDGTIAGCLDSPQAPAAVAGFQAGDELVSIAQSPVTAWEDVSTILSDYQAGDRIQVVLNRDGTDVVTTLELAAAAIPVFDENGSPTEVFTTRAFIGVGPEFIRVAQPISVVPGEMWSMIQRSLTALASFPARIVELGQVLISGEERDPEGPISVVGVTRIGGEIAASELDNADKLFSILSLAAGLNLFLFIFNLLPVLPLDGGHAAGAIYEGIRRKIAQLRGQPDPGPADIARLLPLTYVMMLVLLGLGGIVILADFVAPISLFG
jgi:membrane-associated protease RseP (regulator of RpoE activity)